MIGGVTCRRLPHLPEVPHLHVNRPLAWYHDLLGLFSDMPFRAVFFRENGSSPSPMSRAYSCLLNQHTQKAAQDCDCSIKQPNSYFLVVTLVLFVRNHFKVKQKSPYVNLHIYSLLLTFFHLMNVCVYFCYFEESAALARVAASFLLKRKRTEF